MLTITDFINILRRYYKSPIVSVTIYCTVSLKSLERAEEVFLFSRIFLEVANKIFSQTALLIFSRAAAKELGPHFAPVHV